MTAGSAQVPPAERWHCCQPQPPPTPQAHRAVFAAVCVSLGHTSASLWPPAPPMALPRLCPLCLCQAGRARCGAGSLPRPAALPVLPGHAAPAHLARWPPPVGTWGRGPCGVCPPPALDKHGGISPCCHARRGGCIGVSPVPGVFQLCRGQQDPAWAPLTPNPLSWVLGVLAALGGMWDELGSDPFLGRGAVQELGLCPDWEQEQPLSPHLPLAWGCWWLGGEGALAPLGAAEGTSQSYWARVSWRQRRGRSHGSCARRVWGTVVVGVAQAGWPGRGQGGSLPAL